MAKVVLPEKPIFNYTYKIDGRGIIVRNEDNALIPKDPKNVAYQMYLDWRAEGNAPTVEDPIMEDDLFRPFGVNLERIERGLKDEHANKK
jgi:hypothetical protein